jgi:hypothetical protein
MTTTPIGTDGQVGGKVEEEEEEEKEEGVVRRYWFRQGRKNSAPTPTTLGLSRSHEDDSAYGWSYLFL